MLGQTQSWQSGNTVTPSAPVGFSEYASYLSWVRERHPGSQRLASSVTWSRFGPGGWDAVVAAARDAPGGLCCPTPQQLQVCQSNWVGRFSMSM